MHKLLIADDEKLIRESIVELIDWESLGIQITASCKNGIEALDAIMDTVPDIVMTDIHMPGLDGLDLIEKIHRLDSHIQFIILTGYPEFDYARRALTYGVRQYLLKPISEELIIEAVTHVKKLLPAYQTTTIKNLNSSGNAKASLSDTVKAYVAVHLNDEDLSLKYIAENLLYINVNYLSRTFTKQSGENFSNYLNRTRIEKAQKLLRQNGANHIYAIAEAVGFGSNPQYFSQVFKKYTGFTPSQFAENK